MRTPLLTQDLRKVGDAWLARAARLLSHHPKHITAAVAALFLVSTGGAFAVASLGPDPSALPVREVIESVLPLPLAPQSDALQVHAFNLYTSEVVRPTDSVDTLLARLNVNDPAAALYLRRDPAMRQQVLGIPGRTVTAEADDSRNLQRLVVRWAFDDNSQFKRLVVERPESGGAFTTRIEVAPLVPSLRIGSGTLRSSLFAAVDEAGLPDAVAMQIFEIFSGEIDFHRGLRRGDRFHVVYETLEADGEPLRTGRVVSAEFLNAGRRLDALWFQEPGKAGGYFNFAGQSLERSFLASPMQVSRVTSGFAMRFHPILHTWRAHKGVDYGAPTGTPVRAVGEGKVEFAGWMGGYGNVVQIDHGRGDATVYAHLSRIEVRPGQAVGRGQRIGAVGSTGWATGPHLHFEFRENGVQRDPLEVARRSPPTVLTAEARPAFDRAARALRMQLEAAATTAQVATAR
jgi:murein DD-endopeptidase MepM/ murein hydrolase activator NlpD